MYVALGALPAALMANMEATMGRCYSYRDHECLENQEKWNNPKFPECLKYNPVHEAFKIDEATAQKFVNSVETCNRSESDVLKTSILVGLGGCAAGLLIGILLAR